MAAADAANGERAQESALNWLMHWYQSQCDGEWEHDQGISIETLDNPGWSLKIDLEDTEAHGREMPPRTYGDMEQGVDWWICGTRDNHFWASGGPLQLETMIRDLPRLDRRQRNGALT